MGDSLVVWANQEQVLGVGWLGNWWALWQRAGERRCPQVWSVAYCPQVQSGHLFLSSPQGESARTCVWAQWKGTLRQLTEACCCGRQHSPAAVGTVGATHRVILPRAATRIHFPHNENVFTTFFQIAKMMVWLIKSQVINRIFVAGKSPETSLLRVERS